MHISLEVSAIRATSTPELVPACCSSPCWPAIALPRPPGRVSTVSLLKGGGGAQAFFITSNHARKAPISTLSFCEGKVAPKSLQAVYTPPSKQLHGRCGVSGAPCYLLLKREKCPKGVKAPPGLWKGSVARSGRFASRSDSGGRRAPGLIDGLGFGV